jgi:hypothetical protein
MSQPFDMSEKRDPRAVQILAKNIYREFRGNGFSEEDVLALAGELLSLVTREVREQKLGPGEARL